MVNIERNERRRFCRRRGLLQLGKEEELHLLDELHQTREKPALPVVVSVSVGVLRACERSSSRWLLGCFVLFAMHDEVQPVRVDVFIFTCSPVSINTRISDL